MPLTAKPDPAVNTNPIPAGNPLCVAAPAATRRVSRAIARALLLVGLLSATLGGCGERIEAPTGETLTVFHDNVLHFTPEDTTRHDTAMVSARDKGRVLRTYLELPPRPRPVRITAHLVVRPIVKNITEVVDRWDRAGHIRLLPPAPPPGGHSESVEPGAPVEIVKFMTAYGGRIEHEVDVSHLAPLLQGHCEFEAFIDTWVSPAWELDFSLRFESAQCLDNPAWAQGVLFSEKGLTAVAPEMSTEIIVPEGTRRVYLHALVSGHCTDGRDADEFITKDNVVLVDGREMLRWRPWRDDCRRFRELNPYCRRWSDGSWSSDYSRSGWCPSDVVLPEQTDLSPYLTPGRHTITYRIENIRPLDADGHFGYWRVSCHLLGWR